MRFSGAGPAFGWRSGNRITLGALTAGGEYLLVSEGGEEAFRADARGAWTAQLRHGAPLCVMQGERAVLYDGERLTQASAAMLAAGRSAPPLDGRGPLRQETPVPPRPQAPKERQKNKEVRPEEKTAYRAPSGQPPVDALPVLQWPGAARQLASRFQNNRPVGLFDAPGWRMVQAKEAGMQCCFGYRAEGDRVAEVLYGVRARGGLVPPRGLRGYRYERALDGSGYWVLRQRIQAE